MKKHAGESARSNDAKSTNGETCFLLTDEQKPGVAKKLNAAYALEDYDAAKLALNTLHRELMDLNPSAEFGRGGDADRAPASPADAIVEDHGQHDALAGHYVVVCDRVGVLDCGAQVCRNVKRRHGGDQRER